MENLRKALIENAKEELKQRIEKTNTEEGLKELLKWERKEYKKNPKEKLIKYLTDKNVKALNEKLNFLTSVENAEVFSPKDELIIIVEWKKSRMWGYNPIVYTNFGFEHKGISGCGYDKQSTALAKGLNSDLRILRRLYLFKEVQLKDFLKNNPDKNNKNDFNRYVLGYGSGYNILPTFEGGVGVSSHKEILERLGFNFKHIGTDSTDVFIITQQVKE